MLGNRHVIFKGLVAYFLSNFNKFILKVHSMSQMIEKLNSTNRSDGSTGEELLQIKQPIIEKFQKATS